MSLRDMVIQSKLCPPDRRGRLLRRPRLSQRLRQALDYPLTIVQAGAGYGKSTALAELPDIVERLAWYTITEPDRDPLLFLAHLLAAGERLAPGAAPSFLDSFESAGRRATPAALHPFINALTTSLSQDAILVLDDYHLVADVPDVAALLERLIEYRPPRLHIVLACRQLPDSPALTRWRARGQALTVDRAALAFTEAEIHSLFCDLYRFPITAGQTRRLAAETEGWIIALQMIWQHLQGNQAVGLDAVLERLPNALETLFDYLAQDVLARQPAHIQRFLLTTAVLRQMTGPACDALLEVEGSQATLRQLYHSGLFIASVDQETFHYQPLFHDFLQAQLARDPERAKALQRRAATYFEAAGKAEEAIYHLLEAGDLERAAEKIEQVGAKLVQIGRLDSLVEWMQRLDRRLLDSRPGLRLLAGDVLRLRSQFDDAIAAYGMAERIYAGLGDRRGRSRALRSQAQVYLDTVRPLKATSLLEEALRLLEPHEHPDETAALLEQLAENKLNLGHPDQAQALHREARLLRAEADPNDVYLEARALLRTGRLAEGRRLLETLPADDAGAASRPQRFHREATLLLSLICAMQGDAAAAERYARQGIATGRRLDSPFVEAVGLMRLGHALQLQARFPWRADERRQIQEHYLHAIELVRPFKVTRVQVEPLWGLCRLHGYAGDLGLAERYAEQAIECADQAGDPWLVALIQTSLGAGCALYGEAEAAQRHLEAAAAGFLRVADLFGWTAAQLWLALNAWMQGRADVAMTHCAQFLPAARAGGHQHLFMRCSHLGLKDDQAAWPLLLEAARHQIEPAYVGQLLSQQGLAGVDYHPGYSLFVRTLGSFDVWRGTTPVQARDWQRARARQLFQYLITQRGQWVHRDQALDRLWPALDAESAGRHFKVALNALQRALEPARPAGVTPFFVIRRDAHYALNPAASILLDAEQFERLASSQEAGDLRAAVTLYEGDYLADSLDEEWGLGERERLRQLYLVAAERLALQLLDAGQAEEAIQVSQKMLTQDNCCESAYRLLMRIYAAQGNRAQVQATYNRCVATLREELDVPPAPETQALLTRLMQG